MVDLVEKIKTSEKKLFVGIAGPGTGKSYTFTTIVKSPEYKGKKILILTFINKLADDLANDFKAFENVTVSTLHSFAVRSVGNVELVDALDELVSEDGKFILGKKMDLTKKFHENELTDEETEFYKERKEFYQNDKRIYSFNSVVYVANKIFNDESKIPSDYDLILVDEFQDFNECEAEFIYQLNKKATVVLVGDENQSLYAFKHARPDKLIELYKSEESEEFTLEDCYRCTEVIVDATNDLIRNAKSLGFLKKDQGKQFKYPGTQAEKNAVSIRYPKIDFTHEVPGAQLIYALEKDIKKNLYDEESGAFLKKRVLIIAPSYLKQNIFDGLTSKGFNIVDFEMLSNEEKNKLKHKELITSFNTLAKRKTDNLALRRILRIYLTEKELSDIILRTHELHKKIWTLLKDGVREQVESDIALFKKVRKGEVPLTNEELIRLDQIFILKNYLKKMVKGFHSIPRGAIEVELTTVTSSKGLSADFVYYVGIDDRNTLDQKTKKLTDHKICEFLVGITRAKEKLVLISLQDSNPVILKFLSPARLYRTRD